MKKEKKKHGKKLALRILVGILACIVAFIAVTTVVSIIGINANIKKAKSFEPVKYESQLEPYIDEDGYYTFKTDEDLKIVQLTDVHIGGGWMSIKKDAQAINAVAAMVSAEKPDLVIVTGDISYPVPFQSGTFNNKSGAKIFAELMENLGVYWTLTFGNHDTELYSYYDREDISEFYQTYSHCIHQPGDEDVDGVGNQVINVKSSESIITQSLYMIDSHAYTDDDKLGMKWHYDNIHDNQLEWYKKTVAQLNDENNKVLKSLGKKQNSDIQSLMFLHIPLTEMKYCWDTYVDNGYQDTDNIKLVYGFAGGTGKMVYCPYEEDELYETVKEVGSTKGIFFGHDHRNCLSFDYDGIRLTYGMSIDYLAIPGIYKIGAQRGCTVITVSPDGSFDCKAENYYQDKYTSLYDKEDITMQEITYENGGNNESAK